MFLLLTLAVNTHSLTFPDFKVLISAHNINSVEGILPILPADYRAKYVLVYKTRSLHQASFENPRVIMYGNGGGFIISFNGEKTQAGFDAIEAMEFDQATKEFKFFEINFSAKNPPEFLVAPEKCEKCHGTPPRPVWDTHPAWPGVYGQKYQNKLTPEEASGLNSFLKNQPGHPRYRYLEDIKRFTDNNTFIADAKTRYDGGEKLPPNAELSVILSRLNAQNIASKVSEAQKFKRFQYALLGALDHNCANLQALMPGPAANQFERFLNYTALKNTQQRHLKQLRLSSESDGEDSEALTLFRFFAETGLGLPTAEWTLALEKYSYDFNMPGNISAEIEKYLAAEAATDVKISEMMHLRDYGQPEKYCSFLQRESKRSLQGLELVEMPPIQPPGIQSCVRCHESGVGPAIPFSKPEILAAQLNKKKYRRGTLLQEIQFRLSTKAGADRMPRGTNLAAEEQERLEKYFVMLAGGS